MCHTKQAYEAVIIHIIYTSEETETESRKSFSQGTELVHGRAKKQTWMVWLQKSSF